MKRQPLRNEGLQRKAGLTLKVADVPALLNKKTSVIVLDKLGKQHRNVTIFIAINRHAL